MNKDIDWNKVKFRASSWGNLLAESKEKGQPVGKTAAAELIKIYNQVKYGRRKEIITKQMTKGLICEEDGITLASRIDKVLYVKNEEYLENEWFSGHPDIYSGDDIRKSKTIDDIKISYELDTFTPKLIEKNDPAYNAQLNVYFDLVGPQCQSGSIMYCLVSAPQELIEQEKYFLLRKMNVATEDNLEYKKAARELEFNMVFEDIPIQERFIKHTVKRDEELIQKMKDKVPIMRQWLSDLEKKHTGLWVKNYA